MKTRCALCQKEIYCKKKDKNKTLLCHSCFTLQKRLKIMKPLIDKIADTIIKNTKRSKQWN